MITPDTIEIGNAIGKGATFSRAAKAANLPRLQPLRKNSQMRGAPWKSYPLGPRKPSEIGAGLSPRGHFSFANYVFSQWPQQPVFFLANKLFSDCFRKAA
jgi:hypothetical protein